MIKTNEKALRIKYMRLHEKLLQSSTIILKLEHFNYELFEKKILNIHNKIQKLPKINADSSYMKSLKDFNELIIRTLENEKLHPEKKREILLKEVNLLQKQKNKTVYKRNKYISEDD